MFGLKAWRERRLLQRASLTEEAMVRWTRSPLLRGLNPDERARLRLLACQFMADKTMSGAGGMVLGDGQRQVLALQACLPVMNLGYAGLDGWSEVVVYPTRFWARRTHWDDAAGLVHESDDLMLGEAWERGPLVLSWEDAAAGLQREGCNVVIHEVAHKLDMLNGDVNGHPPLHKGMSNAAWSDAFHQAWEHANRHLGSDPELDWLDPYALENPGEFFAVLSEVFFEWPHPLRRVWPALYAQLAAFYRQDPALRLAE